MRLHLIGALALAVVTVVGCRNKKTPPAPREAPIAHAPIAHATVAIRNVRVFDGERVVPATDVVVDGDRIVAIGTGLSIPAGVEIVDGANRTLLPGLIDAHTHAHDGAQLEQALAFGVTTELDMFSFPSFVKEMRAEDRADRADLRSAGTLATAPGGHGTEYGFEIPTIDDPADAQAFVDARFAEGSDYLKIVHDSGSAYGMVMPTVSAATLRALIDAAHARDKLAVVHIGALTEARTAIDSGADGIVHLFRDAVPDADFGALVARHHAFVTPTLTVLRSVEGIATTLGADPALAPYLGPEAIETLTASFKVRSKAAPGATAQAIAQLRDAGVPILAGTDAPNPGTTHGASVHDELELLVGAGLTPVQALAGATALPAKVFRLADRGRIAVGQRADLLLVDGDPTTTITDTRRIVAVWRAGTKFDRAAFAARVAEARRVAAQPVTLGPISDFDDGTTATRFGQGWEVSTDAMVGGTSTATLTVADGAMTIAGEVVGPGDDRWAGAIFSPGPRAFAPIDLSKKPHLRFRVKGDGKPHLVMVFSKRGGRTPAVLPFPTTTAITTVRFPWTAFDGQDGSDVTAIFIGHATIGRFRLVIDDVAVE